MLAAESGALLGGTSSARHATGRGSRAHLVQLVGHRSLGLRLDARGIRSAARDLEQYVRDGGTVELDRIDPRVAAQVRV